MRLARRRRQGDKAADAGWVAGTSRARTRKVVSAVVVRDDELDRTALTRRPEVTAALVRRAKNRRTWLVIVSGRDDIGKMHPFEHRVVVARSLPCHIQIDERGVSRQHAALERAADGTVQIFDLGSRNGTFVNGERVSRSRLQDGDKIQIGDTTILRFSYQDALDEALQRHLYESATRDPLTRTINKRGFEEALAKEVAFARRHKRVLSLVVLDVDHFKRVNDT
jgi:two-component system, cell cycle response regulator